MDLTFQGGSMNVRGITWFDSSPRGLPRSTKSLLPVSGRCHLVVESWGRNVPRAAAAKSLDWGKFTAKETKQGKFIGQERRNSAHLSLQRWNRLVKNQENFLRLRNRGQALRVEVREHGLGDEERLGCTEESQEFVSSAGQQQFNSERSDAEEVRDLGLEPNCNSDEVEGLGYEVLSDTLKFSVSSAEMGCVEEDGLKSQGPGADVIHFEGDKIQDLRGSFLLKGNYEESAMVGGELNPSDQLPFQSKIFERSSDSGSQLSEAQNFDGLALETQNFGAERQGLLLGRQVFLNEEQYYQRWMPQGDEQDCVQRSLGEVSNDKSLSTSAESDVVLKVGDENAEAENFGETDEENLDTHNQISELSVETDAKSVGGNKRDLLVEFLTRQSEEWDGNAVAGVSKARQVHVLNRGRITAKADMSTDLQSHTHATQHQTALGDKTLSHEGRLTAEILRIASNLPQDSLLEEFLMPFSDAINTSIGNLVLKALGEERLLWQFLSFFQWMRIQDPCLLDSRSFCTLFTYLGKLGMIDRALVYYQNLPADSSFHCVQVYNSLLGALAKCGRTETIPSILLEMERRNIQQDVVTCSILITASNEKGKKRLEKVWGVFDDTLREGVRPNVVLYGSLIKAFCDEGHLKQALLISVSMERMGILLNVIIYNTLIDAHCKAFLFEEAEGLFVDMKDRGLQPSAPTYNALINGYGRNGQPEVSEELLLEMQREGLEPNVSTYTSLISAYGKKMMSEKAMNVFLRMRKMGILPTSHTYTALMNAYAEGGWHEKAQQVFDSMMKEKIQPTVETYTTLLDSYRRAGDLDMVRHVWNEIKEDGCVLTKVTYRTAMDAFAKHGLYVEARDVMEEFRQRGLEPDTMIYNMLLNAYARGGVTTKLPKLLSEMEAAGCEPDSFTYCTLIYGCLRLRDFTKAFEYDKMMLAKGKQPDYPTYKKMRNILDAKYALKLENDKKSDAGNAVQKSKSKNPQRRKQVYEQYKNAKPGTERAKALWKYRPTSAWKKKTT